MAEGKKVKYFLKRYKHPDQDVQTLDNGDHIGVIVPGRFEAGVVYETDGPEEVIHVDGFWNNEEEGRTYTYESGKASSDDGWELD